MAHVVSLRVSIENKLHAFFIDCVVRQMHHHVCEVSRARFLVLLSGESSKPIPRYITSQWINPCDEYIYPKIEFQPRYQVWLVQVSLCDKMFISILHPIEPPRKEYPLTLTAGLGFDYKRLRLLVIELNLEVFRVLWKDPCWWKEVIVLGAASLHGLQVPSQQVLPRERVHTREVVYSLVGLHLEEKLGVDRTVEPVDVPVRVVSFAPGDLII